MLKYILAIYGFLLSFCTIAQIEKMETDRPGKTITPSTTPHKWLQTEMGFLKQTERFQPVLKDLYFQHPAFLVRYGITKRVEVRFITELAYVKEENININSIYKGLNNTQIGGKINFLKEKGIIPKTSLIAHYRLNTLNTNAIGHDSINGGNISLCMLNTISEKFLIGYNLGLEKFTWRYEPMYFYTLSPKFIFAEKWQGFIEIYGSIWKGRRAQTSIDGGMSYYINDDLKVDGYAGMRINKNAKVKFYGIGGSFRFKTSNKN
jgi:hypothetical protein